MLPLPIPSQTDVNTCIFSDSQLCSANRTHRSDASGLSVYLQRLGEIVFLPIFAEHKKHLHRQPLLCSRANGPMPLLSTAACGWMPPSGNTE